MKKNSAVVLMSLVALVGGAGAAATLWAQQPYPTSPTSPAARGGTKDVPIPVGIYTSLVLACDGPRDASARVVIKMPSGEMIVVVGGGQTVVLPGDWKVGQQGQMLINETAGATLYASALSVNGPVNFETEKTKRK